MVAINLQHDTAFLLGEGKKIHLMRGGYLLLLMKEHEFC